MTKKKFAGALTAVTLSAGMIVGGMSMGIAVAEPDAGQEQVQEDQAEAVTAKVVAVSQGGGVYLAKNTDGKLTVGSDVTLNLDRKGVGIAEAPETYRQWVADFAGSLKEMPESQAKAFESLAKSGVIGDINKAAQEQEKAGDEGDAESTWFGKVKDKVGDKADAFVDSFKGLFSNDSSNDFVASGEAGDGLIELYDALEDEQDQADLYSVLVKWNTDQSKKAVSELSKTVKGLDKQAQKGGVFGTALEKVQAKAKDDLKQAKEAIKSKIPGTVVDAEGKVEVKDQGLVAAALWKAQESMKEATKQAAEAANEGADQGEKGEKGD